MTSKSLRLTMLGLVAVCVAGIYYRHFVCAGVDITMAEPTTAQAPFEKRVALGISTARKTCRPS